MSEIKKLKHDLRQQLRALLKKQVPQPKAAVNACDLLLNQFSTISSNKKIAVTLPIEGELDTTQLIKDLAHKGHVLGLPVMMAKGKPLVFRTYKPGDPLEEKIWGIREPLSSAPEITPDVVICPLLGFDRARNRLGHGAGYYDATLKRLRARGQILAVGFAWALQEVESIPTESWDQRLDAIVTEREVILPELDRL